jgi:hypothetical protein
MSSFGGEEGTGGSELTAGVEVGGGQPESGAWAGRSLATDKPRGTRVSLGGEARRYAGWRRVAAGSTEHVAYS